MPPPASSSSVKDTASLSSGSTSANTKSRGDRPKDWDLDTSVLAQLAKRALIEALNEIAGAKTLVLDPSLSGPLGLVIEPALLKQHGVDKLFWLESSEMLTAPTKNIVWMCRPRISWMKVIASQIKAHGNQSPTPQHAYSILLVPRATELCRCVLEEEGVLGDVVLKSYELGFLPVEKDVLSLELESSAKDIFLSRDETSVYYAAQALNVVQKAYGVIPRIVGKGDAAEHLSRQLQALREHDSPGSTLPLPLSTEIDAMIVLDRSVDWLTPMCTQWTYEGLVDEVVGIKSSHVEVAESTATTDLNGTSTASSGPTPAASNKKKKHLLNSSDKVFHEIRDLPLGEVGPRLNRIAKRIKDAYSQGRSGKDLAQIKDFVGKLGGLQSEHQALALHTTLSETLLQFAHGEEFNTTMEIQQSLIAGDDLTKQQSAIDDLISQGLPLNTVLRLLIILSLTAGGLKPKVFDAVRRELLQAYGYHHLPLLISLSNLHLLSPLPTSTSTASTLLARTLPSPFPNSKSFSALRRSLRLMVDDSELEHSNANGRPMALNDIAYTYSGYAPLSVRLVQCVAQKASVLSTSVHDPALDENGGGSERAVPRAHPIVGWRGFEDVVNSLPGTTFEHVQSISADSDSVPGAHRAKDYISTTLVFFLGGCTFAEISALRKMRAASKGRRFLICTTSIISGNSLLDSFSGPAPVPILREES